jgi:hypothetical protein
MGGNPHGITPPGAGASPDQPPPLVDVELHQALVPHFQQQRLASFLIGDIGAFHDFVNLQRLLAKRVQDIFPIIQHNWIPAVINRAPSLKIRKLVFGDHTLDILRFAPDAVSKTPVRLDRHQPYDRVDHRRIGFSTPLRTLAPVMNIFIQLVGV